MELTKERNIILYSLMVVAPSEESKDRLREKQKFIQITYKSWMKDLSLEKLEWSLHQQRIYSSCTKLHPLVDKVIKTKKRVGTVGDQVKLAVMFRVIYVA